MARADDDCRLFQDGRGKKEVGVGEALILLTSLFFLTNAGTDGDLQRSVRRAKRWCGDGRFRFPPSVAPRRPI